MRRARKNVVTLVQRLSDLGYRFVDPERAHVPPSPTLADEIAHFESHGLHVPLALRVWYEEVGEVNLMGDHPDWPCRGYLFDNRRKKGQREWYTDPLVVENVFSWAYDSWQESAEEDGIEEVVPCCLEIAPDAGHKANVSGGDSYEVPTDVPAIDTLLRNEPHGVTFVEYLRIAFAWGGFPGFEKMSDAPVKFLDELLKGLFVICCNVVLSIVYL
jgi:hypothetical protein